MTRQDDTLQTAGEGYQTPLSGRIGRYELVARLGEGGMGEVLLARLRGESGFEKLVVIKRLRADLELGAYVTMFLDEARLSARLAHPNVCEVFELGTEEGRHFLVMQHLEGADLTRVLEAAAALPEEARLRLATGLLVQACEGLHHAHELRDEAGQPLGVVHRDVSPSNLFVTLGGVLKVLDFGIAKARTSTARTDTGMIKGKYPYMSPEQVRGEPIDRRSDVFALGICLYEALTGKPLFHRATEALSAMAVLDDEVPRVDAVRPAVPAALADAVAQALARDRAHRPPTARALGLALSEAARPLGGIMPGVEIGEHVTRWLGGAAARQRARAGEPRPAAPEEAASPVDDASRPPDDASRRTLLARPAPAPPAAASSEVRRRAVLPWIAPLSIAVLLAVVAVRQWTGVPAPPPAPDARAAAFPLSLPAAIAPAMDGPARAAAPPPRPERAPADRREAERRGDRRPGFLSVDSKPWARLFIDDRPSGMTPLLEHALPPGRHRVRAVLDSGAEQSFTVHIEPNKTAPARQLRW